MIKTCPTCIKEFKTNPKTPKQIYCSRACWRKSLFKQVERTCENCGKTFSVMQNRQDARFCSWECHTAKTEKICAHCGAKFYVKRSAAQKRSTCSRSCLMKLRAAEKRAPNQGKPRTIETRQKVSEGLKRYYQEDPSRHWNYQNGPFTQLRGVYSTWQAKRKAARERDNYKCRICDIDETKYGKQLSVHHIRPFRYFASAEEANHLDNLICVCQSCHMKIEHGKIDITQFVK